MLPETIWRSIGKQQRCWKLRWWLRVERSSPGGTKTLVTSSCPRQCAQNVRLSMGSLYGRGYCLSFSGVRHHVASTCRHSGIRQPWQIMQRARQVALAFCRKMRRRYLRRASTLLARWESGRRGRGRSAARLRNRRACMSCRWNSGRAIIWRRSLMRPQRRFRRNPPRSLIFISRKFCQHEATGT